MSFRSCRSSSKRSIARLSAASRECDGHAYRFRETPRLRRRTLPRPLHYTNGKKRNISLRIKALLRGCLTTAVLVDCMELVERRNGGTIEHLRQGESTRSMVKPGNHFLQADFSGLIGERIPEQ